MNIRGFNIDGSYVLDGHKMCELVRILDRLYNESIPLVTDERRDLAQRLHALLEHAEEM